MCDNYSASEYLQNKFNESIKSNELCDQCKTNKKDKKFYLDRYSDYYFCNDECMQKYINVNLCKRCHHWQGKNLKQLGDFMYCVNKRNNIISCYEFEVGDYVCTLCGENENTHKSRCFILHPPSYSKYCGDRQWFLCNHCFTSHHHGYKCYELSEKIKSSCQWIDIYNDDCMRVLDDAISTWNFL
jgi:hypothetical protein